MMKCLVSLLALALCAPIAARAGEEAQRTVLRVITPAKSVEGEPTVICFINDGGDRTIEHRDAGMPTRIRFTFPGVPEQLRVEDLGFVATPGWEVRPVLRHPGVIQVGIQPIAESVTLLADHAVCLEIDGFDPLKAPIGLGVEDPHSPQD